MREIKRYDISLVREYARTYWEALEEPDGEFVKYQDLEGTITQLRADLQAANARADRAEKELNLYKRAFERVCDTFNYGDESEGRMMKKAFLRVAKEAHDER